MHLGPLCGVPAHGAVQNITVLTVYGRWLWAHIVGHYDGVGAASRHFMNAVHLAGLEPHTAGLSARLEVGVVPSWRARVIVTSADQSLRTCIVGAQERRRWLLIAIPHAQDKRFLDPCTKKAMLTRQAMQYNIILRSVRVTIIAVEKQYIHIV